MFRKITKICVSYRPFSLLNGHRILDFFTFLRLFWVFLRHFHDFFFENRYLSQKIFSYHKIFSKSCFHWWKMFRTFSGHFWMNIHENSSIWKSPPPLKPSFRGRGSEGGWPFRREKGGYVYTVQVSIFEIVVNITELRTVVMRQKDWVIISFED